MRKPIPIRGRRKPSEEGYILVVVVFMLAILMISLTVAAPVIKKDIQRDREIETMHRGKQYTRAVKLYYKKFGAYPANADALVKTNEIRFLRKKYIDPTTGKAEWKPILFGQNKTQTLGFFGQPIVGFGAAPAGIGPAGGSGATDASAIAGALNSTIGSGSASGSTDSVTNPTAPASGAGSTGSSGGSGSGSSTGLTGQTFGGGPIIGFSPNSPKQSILVYKKKNHYNEWEFFYDPLTDQTMIQNSPPIAGQQSGAPGAPSAPTAPGAPSAPTQQVPQSAPQQ